MSATAHESTNTLRRHGASDGASEHYAVPAPLALVAAMLFVSGCCALVFQVVWMRELRLVFGATTAASAAVLAVFMGGLGLGNAVLGGRIDRSRRPLGVYGWLEIGIAASVALTPLLLWATQRLYIGMGGQSTLGPTAATLLRLGLSVALMGLPTFLMGGTMPAAARAVADDLDARRGRVALVYGLNTLGAVLGAALATFVLLEALGSRGALWATCGLNLLLGVTAVGLSRRGTAKSANTRATKATSKPAAFKSATRAISSDVRPLPAALVYLAAGIVGFAFFLQEIVWYRMLGPLLGGTVYTFGLILCVALLGIGLGGAAYHLLGRRLRPTATAFAWTCGLEALAIAVPFALGDRIALWVLGRQEWMASGFNPQLWTWFQVASLVILPASLISGVQFPLLIGLAGQGREHVGAQVGRTFAANTLGAIGGSLAGGFLVLPWLTAPGAWQAIVGLLSLLAVATLMASARTVARERRQQLRHVSPLLVVVAALACLATTGPTAVWRHAGIGAGRASRQLKLKGNRLRDWTQGQRRIVIWEAEGRESSVAITALDSMAFVVNGKSDGHAILDAGTQIGSGLVGPLLADTPKSPRGAKALVVGLGTGETAGWLAALPTTERVDVVELEPAIVEMARRCAPLNCRALDNPKLDIIFNDGREELLTRPGSYDFIISEPSNPYRAGIASLYTREFYTAVHDRLTPNGLMLQWMQGYEVDRRTILIVLRTLREVFPRVEIWRTQATDLLLVCGRGPAAPSVDLDELRARLRQPVMAEGLRLGLRVDDAEGFLAHYLCGTRTIDNLLAQDGPPVNTDDRNLLEYAFARSLAQASEFSPPEVLRLARSIGDAYPAGVPRTAWPTIDRRRLAMNAGWGMPPAVDAASEADRPLATFFSQYMRNDYAAAVQALADGPGPDCPITRLAHGHALSETGAELPAELAAWLEANHPVDAAALAVIRARQMLRPAAAADAMVRMAELSRENPWGSLPLVDAAFSIAAAAGRSDPLLARRIHDALALPFAGLRCDQRRLMARYALAEHLGPAEASAACAAFEPHILWNESFLRLRAESYSRMHDPRAAAAYESLRRYRENN